MVALCIGLASVVVTVYFTLMSPTVIARWTGYSYPAIVGVMVLAWVAFAFMLARPGLIGERLLAWPMLAAWNVLFVLMLVLTIVPHQVALPAEQQAFPFYVPDASPWWQIPLYVMLILSPVVFADFVVYARELSAEGPSMRQLGGGFALAALLLLVMVFLQVFTTIYDYARPIGPLFRDRFWLVYLLAGLGLALPVWLVGSKEVGPAGRRAQPAVPLRQPRREQRRETMHSGEETLHSGEETMRFVVRAAGGLAIVTGLALLLTAGRGPGPIVERDAARHDIQHPAGVRQGRQYSAAGSARAIRRVQPDVLGVEESDTARVANGNTDAVRYFADNLGMYSYYGPSTTAGTFGIALLSKYPIVQAATFYLYSTGEQTACIQAVIAANGAFYNVFVTHLGNGGPMVQLIDVLNWVDGASNVILMGDFNFEPSTPQYTLASRTLADVWLVRWPDGRQLTGPGGKGAST